MLARSSGRIAGATRDADADEAVTSAIEATGMSSLNLVVADASRMAALASHDARMVSTCAGSSPGSSSTATIPARRMPKYAMAQSG